MESSPNRPTKPGKTVGGISASYDFELGPLNDLCLRKLLVHSVKLLVDKTKHALNLEVEQLLQLIPYVMLKDLSPASHRSGW